MTILAIDLTSALLISTKHYVINEQHAIHKLFYLAWKKYEHWFSPFLLLIYKNVVKLCSVPLKQSFLCYIHIFRFFPSLKNIAFCFVLMFLLCCFRSMFWEPCLWRPSSPDRGIQVFRFEISCYTMPLIFTRAHEAPATKQIRITKYFVVFNSALSPNIPMVCMTIVVSSDHNI